MSESTIEKPERNLWRKQVGRRWLIRDIKRRERLYIWLQGLRDAKTSSVEISEEGYLIGPYANQLAQIANKAIAVEWEHCTSDVLTLESYLDKMKLRYEEQIRRLINACGAVKEKGEAAVSEHHSGDDGASEAILERRKSFRKAKATEADCSLKKECIAQLEHIAEESVEALDDYLAREEIALKHEQIIVYEYIQKIDIYLRGLKHNLSLPTLDIKPQDLVSEPRLDYFSAHPRYDFTKHMRIASNEEGA